MGRASIFQQRNRDTSAGPAGSGESGSVSSERPSQESGSPPSLVGPCRRCNGMCLSENWHSLKFCHSYGSVLCLFLTSVSPPNAGDKGLSKCCQAGPLKLRITESVIFSLQQISGAGATQSRSLLGQPFPQTARLAQHGRLLRPVHRS